jgi:hypothetical protein
VTPISKLVGRYPKTKLGIVLASATLVLYLAGVLAWLNLPNASLMAQPDVSDADLQQLDDPAIVMAATTPTATEEPSPTVTPTARVVAAAPGSSLPPPTKVPQQVAALPATAVRREDIPAVPIATAPPPPVVPTPVALIPSPTPRPPIVVPPTPIVVRNIVPIRPMTRTRAS